MTCRFFVSLIDRCFLKNFATKKRYCMDFTAFETKIFKIRCKDFSAFIPFRDNVEIFSNLTIIIFISLNISFLFLTIPSKKSQFNSLSKLILFFSLKSLFFISFFLFHYSFNLMISYSSFLNLFIIKNIFSSYLKVY